MIGVVAFLDMNWSTKWTSTFGVSFVDIDNSDGQAPSAFKKGQYALANLLYHPTSKLYFGPEIQWGDRENFSDGFVRRPDVQFSMRYDFGFRRRWQLTESKIRDDVAERQWAEDQ